MAGIPLAIGFSPEFGSPLDDRVAVVDITARNAITAVKRFLGLEVYVIGDDCWYQLRTGIANSDWEIRAEGGGGVVSLIEPLVEIGIAYQETLQSNYVTTEDNIYFTGTFTIPAGMTLVIDTNSTLNIM